MYRLVVIFLLLATPSLYVRAQEQSIFTPSNEVRVYKVLDDFSLNDYMTRDNGKTRFELQLITRYPLDKFYYHNKNLYYISIAYKQNSSLPTGLLQIESVYASWITNYTEPFAWYTKYNEETFNAMLTSLRHADLKTLGYDVSVLGTNDPQYSITLEPISTLTTYGVRINLNLKFKDTTSSYDLTIEETIYYDKHIQKIVFYSFKMLDVIDQTSVGMFIQFEAENYDFGFKSPFHITRILGVLVVLFPTIFSLWVIYNVILSSPNKYKKYAKYTGRSD